MNLRITTSVTLSLISISSLYAGDPRIVGCDEIVQSHKRGVCENHMNAADFQALAPGVSWFYNWDFKPNDLPTTGCNMTYIPMVWGNFPASLTGVQDYLAHAEHKPPVILAINEPNLKGQAFISPEITANLFKQVRQIGDSYQIPVVGPNMAMGSAPGDSITAFDPVENKQMTYTFMVPFMKAFASFLGDPAPQAAAVHTYGPIGEMKWAVDTLHKTTNTPIWVTEYAFWNAGSDQDEIKYMMEATDFLERTDYVQGYSWFKERMDNAKMSLLTKESGKLSPLGEAYVSMPVHDKDVFYRIPGSLSAGKYCNLNNADIYVSKHNTIMIDSKAGNTSADYNISVDNAGAYTLNVHFFGKGIIKLTERTTVLGNVSGDSTEMYSLPVNLVLSQGCHTITVNFQSNGVLLDSLEFVTK